MSDTTPAARRDVSPLQLRSYPEAAFGGFTRCDGTIPFLDRVHALLPARGRVLDVGCGRGQQSEDPCDHRRRLADLRGGERRVIGIDVDPAAAANPFLDEFRRIDDVLRWPVEDASVDLAISVSVLEHVPEPDAFFDEVARVLKPGGVLCLRTPNKRSYPAVAARLVPNRFHAGGRDGATGSQGRRRLSDRLSMQHRSRAAKAMPSPWARSRRLLDRRRAELSAVLAAALSPLRGAASADAAFAPHDALPLCTQGARERRPVSRRSQEDRRPAGTQFPSGRIQMLRNRSASP